MQKLVSVNITTYNRAHLLSRCLDSVIDQDYNNTEIVIVDDCSTDDTHEIICKYKKKYNIIYHKNKENRGNAYSRNKALELCKGYYVAFMDDDDEWIDKKKISKQVSIFEKHDETRLGIVCSNVRIHRSEYDINEKIIKKPVNIKKYILQKNGIIYNSTVLTKREIMFEVGGFDTKLSRGIDSDYYRKCIVMYNYDFIILKDITTSVYEYGHKRISDNKENQDIIKHIKSNIHCIKKYKKWWFMYPLSLIVRMSKIVKYVMQLIINKKELVS